MRAVIKAFSAIFLIAFIVLIGLIVTCSISQNIQVTYRVSGTVYGWLDAPDGSYSWVYDASKDADSGKKLVPLEGAVINYYNYEQGFPVKLFSLQSSADGTFDSGVIKAKRKLLPRSLAVSRDGYMSCSCWDFSDQPVDIILIKPK